MAPPEVEIDPFCENCVVLRYRIERIMETWENDRLALTELFAKGLEHRLDQHAKTLTLRNRQIKDLQAQIVSLRAQPVCA